MRHHRRVRTALALLGGLCLAATGAAAQTGAPTSPGAGQPGAAAPAPGPATQINPTADQATAIFKSLESLIVQSLGGFQPSVGAPVPPDLQTQPMPPAGGQVLPEAKDHHVAKTDDNTILIVDPITRQVVGVVKSITIDGSTMGQGTTGQGTTGQGPMGPGTTGPGTSNGSPAGAR
jgi:hypothetical protein